MFGFKGGKGVATMIGILAAINPIVLAILLVYGVILFLVTKIVSISSITAAILLQVLMFFLNGHTLEYIKGNSMQSFSVYLGFSIIFALIILFNHRENIKRLRNGEENRFTKKLKNNEKSDKSKNSENKENNEEKNKKKEENA